MFELDHVFVATSNPDAAVAELVGVGLTLGHRGVHPNQGTANAVFFFDNVYLELLWVDDPALVARPVVVQSTLPTRLAWPKTRCSPFGISFRHAQGIGDAPLPIPTWGWPAPFLPPGALPIPIGCNSTTLLDPLVFASLVTRRPDQRDVPLQHTLGVHDVDSVDCVVEGSGPLAAELMRLMELGVATFARGPAPRLRLRLDGGRQQRVVGLSELPLDLLF